MAAKHPPNHEHIDHEMLKMEVNLDDISGEVLGYLMDLLIESGANDVYYTSIYMKKNRPGTLLQLLCSQENLEKMKRDIIYRNNDIRCALLSVIRASSREKISNSNN